MLASREWKSSPSFPGWERWRLNAPSAASSGVTSHSVNWSLPIAPASPAGPVVGAGRLLQVRPVSDQPFVVPRTAGPFEVLVIDRRRSFALVTRPLIPATWKRRKLSTSGSEPPSVRSRFSVPKLLPGCVSSTRASASGANVSVWVPGVCGANVAEKDRFPEAVKLRDRCCPSLHDENR